MASWKGRRVNQVAMSASMASMAGLFLRAQDPRSDGALMDIWTEEGWGGITGHGRLARFRMWQLPLRGG